MRWLQPGHGGIRGHPLVMKHTNTLFSWWTVQVLSFCCVYESVKWRRSECLNVKTKLIALTEEEGNLTLKDGFAEQRKPLSFNWCFADIQSSPLLWVTCSQKGFLVTTRPQRCLENTERFSQQAFVIIYFTFFWNIVSFLAMKLLFSSE